MEELPLVLEVREPELQEPLGDLLVPLDASVELGSDFRAFEITTARMLTDFMTGGRVSGAG